MEAIANLRSRFLDITGNFLLVSPVFRPFGVDFFCMGKKFLVFNLVSRNLKIKYRRSVFGIFWTLLNPLALACIYYFVFKLILNIKIPYYLPFILSGVIPWAFFSQTIIEGMESLVGNWGLITKIPVPLQVFPYVGALTNLVTLALATPILLGAAVFSGVSIGPAAVIVVFYFVALFLMAYSLSTMLSVAFAYFRDLKHIMGIVMQLWFYGSPVLYDESMIPEAYKWVLFVNPVGQIFAGIHQVLVRGLWPSGANILAVSLWSIGIVLATLFFQKNFMKGVVERL